VKKIDALLARAGEDDRVRGAFRYHGASTGRWSGEGFQPQNLKRPVVEDLDAAVAAVATGDYAHRRIQLKGRTSPTRWMMKFIDEAQWIGGGLQCICAVPLPSTEEFVPWSTTPTTIINLSRTSAIWQNFRAPLRR
jgi:hypothetical protein